MELKRKLLYTFVASIVMTPICQATPTWSGCQTVTAVSNYLAADTIYLVFSPGIPGCSSDAPGAATWRIGQMGMTADTMKSFLATALTAFATGRQVMIYFENATPTCFASFISVGGYSGQCP